MQEAVRTRICWRIQVICARFRATQVACKHPRRHHAEPIETGRCRNGDTTAKCHQINAHPENDNELLFNNSKQLASHRLVSHLSRASIALIAQVCRGNVDLDAPSPQPAVGEGCIPSTATFPAAVDHMTMGLAEDTHWGLDSALYLRAIKLVLTAAPHTSSS